MKTSKKLLSLFLAVVMVVTTCSVGFTAFAKDNKNSIWTTDKVSAENAFDSLNGVADQYLPGLLMNIKEVADLVYAQYAKENGVALDKLSNDTKEDIKKDTTLTDILCVVQPLLIEKILYSKLMEDQVSQSSFVKELMTEYPDHPTYADSNYNYLNDRDDPISFYALYLLSKDYMTGGDNADKVSKTTNEELADLYAEFKPLADLYRDLKVSQESMGKDIKEIAEQMSGYEKATLYDLQHFPFDPSKAGVTESQLASYYQTQQQKLKAYGVNVKIENIGTLIYYSIGAGRFFKDAGVMYDLVKAGGGIVTFTGTAKVDGTVVNYDIKTDISIDNFVKVLTEPFLAQKEMTIDEYATSKRMTKEQAESYLQNELFPVYNRVILMGDTQTSSCSPFYKEMITGLAVKYYDRFAVNKDEDHPIKSINDLEKLVAEEMPEGWGTKDCVLSKAELEQLASPLLTYDANNANFSPKEELRTLFKTGSVTGKDWDYNTFTFRLPDTILGSTAAREYFSILMTATNNNNNLRNAQVGMTLASVGQECFDDYYVSNYHYNEAGYVVWDNEVPIIGSPDGRNEDGTIEENTINGYFALAEDYIRSKLVADMFGEQLNSKDPLTLDTLFEVRDVAEGFIDKKLTESGESQEVVLNDEQKAQLNKEVDLTGQVGTDLLNVLLNNTIIGFLNTSFVGGGKPVKSIIKDLAVTPIDTAKALDNLWTRLMASPVATIVEVLPVLTVLIDEVLEAIAFNSKGDMYNGFLYGMLSDAIAGKILDNGSYIGINQLSWDLNKLLPELLHWMLGDEKYGYTYYDSKMILKDENYKAVEYTPLNVFTADFENYIVKDAEGNVVKANFEEDENGNRKIASLDYMKEKFEDAETLYNAYPSAKFNCYIPTVILKDENNKAVEYTPLNVFSADFEHYIVRDTEDNVVKAKFVRDKKDNIEIVSLSYMGTEYKNPEALNKDYPDKIFKCYYPNIIFENKEKDGIIDYTPLNVFSADFEHYIVRDTKGNIVTKSFKEDKDGKLVKDKDGNLITILNYMGKPYDDSKALNKDYPSAIFNCYYTYNGEIPYFTGIYLVDTKLAYAKTDYLPIALSAKILESNKDDPTMTAEKANAIGSALGEVIEEFAVLFLEATEQFLATPELVGNTRYDKSSNKPSLNNGLNNIFVALPQLFDIMEDLAAEKYGVDKDAWTYCYEGKIVKEKITDDKSTMINTSLEKFKPYGASDSDDRKYDIFDCFAQIFMGDWLNAIVSLVNNAVATDNKISDSIPIISSLLGALGGLGEKSIITDVLNGIFQIDRENDYSFTFETQPNGFNGWTKDNAYFLLANIGTLIEAINNIKAAKDAAGNGDNGGNNGNTPDKTVDKYSQPKAAQKAKADSNNYTDSDLSNATDLIGNLDKLLSSLLSDSTFNDFSLDQTDNILASLVTFLTNYFGNDFNENSKSIVRLINAYSYYITGSETHKADANHDVDDKKVYTNDSLTGLVVETYLLVEDLSENLLAKYNDNKIAGGNAQYNLIVEAIEGLISPDAVAIRLDDYGKVQKKLDDYNCWHNAAAQTSRGDYKIKLDWGIKPGDKAAFYDALSASLRLVTSIVGVLLIDTGWYNSILTPVLNAICAPNGIKIEAYDKLKKDKDATGYYDETLIAILTPVSELINTLLAKPATTLIKTIQGLATILDDSQSPTITSILNTVFGSIADELNGVANIFVIDNDTLQPTSPTLAKLLKGEISTKGLSDIAKKLNVKFIRNYPKSITLGACNKDKDGNTTEDFSLPLTGSNLIPIINTYLVPSGITLKQINWNKLSTAKTPAAALVYVLDYLLESVLDPTTGILDKLSTLIGPDVVNSVIQVIKDNNITSKDILAVIDRILEASDSPTLAYWTFVQYLQEMAYNFTYPAGITKAMADAAVGDLDNLVANLFPLLSSLGVDLGGNDISAVLNAKLFKNDLITTIATALYGALDGLDPTIKTVLKGLGIVTSTKDVATLLTDSSYGATYSSAAKTISAQSSWKNVKNVNWGFKDGASNAQQGFVNALVAVLRPLINVLNVFLNEGTLQIDDVLYETLCTINVPRTVTTTDWQVKDVKFKARIAYAMRDGVFAVSVREDPSSHGKSRSSTLKLDFKSLKNLDDLKLCGTNGYNSAIIPLLEALQCGNIKTYAQYQSDAATAKDNILLDILNPILGTSSKSLLSKIAANPFSELTKLIPNIAMYLEADGLVQLVANLLAPVTDIAGMTGEGSVAISNLIEELLGAPIQDMAIPLVNQVLAKNNINITLPAINWSKLTSLGTATTYTSNAVGDDGRYLTGKMVGNVDQGKVLITVLRYIATVLVDNATAIKNLICSIEAVAKNDLISSIIKSVFNTISTSTPDQIIAALFYILESEPTNAFWDYTNYKVGKHTFAYPETVDVEFLKSLPPMLDGLIGGLLDLNGLISDNLYKDELISKLATGLYGAVEGVKINDNMTLTSLLAQTDIDFSTGNVSKLLKNEKYGKTYADAASVIASAGSWKNVKVESLKWGVTDRDSFFHALAAVLRPVYGVLDVLLNDADLGLFDLVRVPGSNGYTSSIVPLLEAFGCYNVKTQYQYRQDINKEYDAILLDIINPLWDKVEDLLSAPLQTLTAMVPNLALFIGNDGLCQIIDNLLTPISALADSLRPIVDLNSLLTTIFKSLNVDLNGILAKIGVTNFSLDVYNLKKTLSPLLSGDAIIPLVNNILGMINIKGTKLGIKLNPVDWLQLASHGKTITAASQAPTYGPRIYVEGDSSETLIAVLRYLIVTINTGDNFNNISSLVGSLIGGADSNVSDIVGEVLGMLQGDTDEVISALVDLLQSLA